MIRLLVFLAITLVPRHISKPTIRSHEGSRYTIENPLLDFVEIKLNCGYEWEPVLITMSPRTREVVVVDGPDRSSSLCFIDSWKKRIPARP